MKTQNERLALDERVKKRLRALIPQIVDAAIDTALRGELVKFDRKVINNAVEEIILNGVVESTKIGLTGSLSIASVEAFQSYYLGLAVDGVTLSERIRKNTRVAELVVRETVQRHISSGTTFKRLTKELTEKRVSTPDIPKYLRDIERAFLDVTSSADPIKMRKLIATANQNIARLADKGAPTEYLKKAYSKVVAAVEKNDSRLLRGAVENAVSKRAIYQNEVVARTEMAKAYSKAFHRSINDDDSVTAVRSVLSPDHNVVDFCDVSANADLYGLGSGVYPKNDAPDLPYHQNCLCSLEPVYELEVDGRKNRYSDERAQEYLKNESETRRDSIIGKNGSVTRWRDTVTGASMVDDESRAFPKHLFSKND